MIIVYKYHCVLIISSHSRVPLDLDTARKGSSAIRVGGGGPAKLLLLRTQHLLLRTKNFQEIVWVLSIF